jgi:hypothetical protein
MELKFVKLVENTKCPYQRCITLQHSPTTNKKWNSQTRTKWVQNYTWELILAQFVAR